MFVLEVKVVTGQVELPELCDAQFDCGHVLLRQRVMYSDGATL